MPLSYNLIMQVYEYDIHICVYRYILSAIYVLKSFLVMPYLIFTFKTLK